MFKEYDSMEDAFADMRRAEEEANARLTDEQKSIGYGDYWGRVVVMGEPVGVFGRIHTFDEQEESRKNVDPEEAQFEREQEEQSFARGYRFGKAWSQLEPRGELGTTHIANMKKLTKEQFEQAEEYGWDVMAMYHGGQIDWILTLPVQDHG